MSERFLRIDQTAIDAIATDAIRRWEDRYGVTLEAQGYTRNVELARMREQARASLEIAYAAQNPDQENTQ